MGDCTGTWISFASKSPNFQSGFKIDAGAYVWVSLGCDVHKDPSYLYNYPLQVAQDIFITFSKRCKNPF